MRDLVGPHGTALWIHTRQEIVIFTCQYVMHLPRYCQSRKDFVKGQEEQLKTCFRRNKGRDEWGTTWKPMGSPGC